MSHTKPGEYVLPLTLYYDISLVINMVLSLSLSQAIRQDCLVGGIQRYLSLVDGYIQ